VIESNSEPRRCIIVKTYMVTEKYAKHDQLGRDRRTGEAFLD